MSIGTEAEHPTPNKTTVLLLKQRKRMKNNYLIFFFTLMEQGRQSNQEKSQISSANLLT
jgi:hypothetical protein